MKSAKSVVSEHFGSKVLHGLRRISFKIEFSKLGMAINVLVIHMDFHFIYKDSESSANKRTNVY